ncbi:hypothetical protein QFZ22_000506 [Streptomyces canus]|uniref:Secreted protein n=1 Tax=Streptomyces canus TaxID=58343 RepID=A0AAW8F362_9ACTN|nr:hypothetical protein [Streptomyces canus]MDQ0904521.1 hypothetical protein [Streptomyces canus]
MKTHFAAALGSVVLTAGTLLGAPAAGAQTDASLPTTFNVPVGNTWTKGTVTWFARSVEVVGTHKSVSAAGDAYCRRTWAYTYDSHDNKIGSAGSASSDTACGNTKSYRFTVPADVYGGATFVRVCLDDGNYKDLLCSPRLQR